MLACSPLAAPSLHLCLLDTHFLSFTPHKAKAHCLADFPTPGLKLCFLSVTGSCSSVLLGSGENPRTLWGLEQAHGFLYFRTSQEHSSLANQGQDFLELKQLIRQHPNQRSHKLSLSVPHEFLITQISKTSIAHQSDHYEKALHKVRLSTSELLALSKLSNPCCVERMCSVLPSAVVYTFGQEHHGAGKRSIYSPAFHLVGWIQSCERAFPAMPLLFTGKPRVTGQKL